MVRELFVNGSILIASISMGSQIFKETGLTIAKSLKSKILEGLTAGILGVVLMYFSISYNNMLVVDFRSLAVVLSAVYGGIISSTITALIICFFRVFLYGINSSSLIAVINILSIGILSGLIAQSKLTRLNKWSMLICSSLLINTFTFYIILKNQETFLEIIPFFVLGTLVISVFLYHYTSYLESFNLYNQKLKEEAMIDYLTGLNNVREFDKILGFIKNEVKEKNDMFSLLYMDIDFFKKVNDTYGHISGDAILEQLGKIISLNCRNLDLVFRIGGEEFAVLLQNCSTSKAEEIAERIRYSVENHFFVLDRDTTINITISIGIATYTGNPDDFDKIKEYADSALYQAKSNGRNQVCVSSQANS